MESHAWSRELLIENESENEELLLKDCFGTSMSAHLQTSHELLGRNEMKTREGKVLRVLPSGRWVPRNQG